MKRSAVALAKRLAGEIPPIRRLVEERNAARSEAEQARRQLDELRRSCGFPPGHYYSPIPSLAEIEAHEARIFDRPRHCPGIDLNEAGQLRLLEELAPYCAEIPFGPNAQDGLRYYFENPFYTYTDGVMLYCMLRHNRPARVIEIGAGFSSALILDVNERNFNNRMTCTLIEPDLERLLGLLKPGDVNRVEIRRERVQDVDLELFSELEDSDMLLVDSTHVSKIGSDVNHIVFNILPILKRGVLIHIHDIFLPLDYPKKWIYEHRFWNELYLVRAFLQFNKSFEILLLTKYIENFHGDWLKKNMPLCLRHPGAQLWIRRI